MRRGSTDRTQLRNYLHSLCMCLLMVFAACVLGGGRDNSSKHSVQPAPSPNRGFTVTVLQPPLHTPCHCHYVAYAVLDEPCHSGHAA